MDTADQECAAQVGLSAPRWTPGPELELVVPMDGAELAAYTRKMDNLEVVEAALKIDVVDPVQSSWCDEVFVEITGRPGCEDLDEQVRSPFWHGEIEL
jgi:hypothetical protein